MVANGAITFSYSISNAFLGPFHLNDIIKANYSEAAQNNRALYNEWNSDMSNATTMTAVVSFVSVAVFVWFQPSNAEMVRRWNEEWKSTCTGVTGMLIGFGCFAYGTVTALAQVIDPDACSILLGGEGC